MFFKKSYCYIWLKNVLLKNIAYILAFPVLFYKHKQINILNTVYFGDLQYLTRTKKAFGSTTLQFQKEK